MQRGFSGVGEAIELTRLPAGSGGAKAQRLGWLARNGYRTPGGVLVPGSCEDIEALLSSWIDPDISYVVRSSADVEDGDTSTFAGQFDSVVDVQGLDAVAAAVVRVRQSGRSGRVRAYRSEVEGDVACIVQPMLRSKVGGVVFTRNPVNGLDETIVEAVVGSPSQVLADGREPDRWVHRWGEFVSAPAATAIDSALVNQVVDQARQIASRFGKPLDLEWVWDGDELWWVQLRPIGGIDVTVYSNRIAREVLPGAIKPLVWSLNVPLVNGAWIRLIDEAIGRTGLAADDLARRFGCHAYFNMTAMGDIFARMGMPRESLELLLGLPEGPDRPSMKPGVSTLRRLPRMLTFAARRGRVAPVRALLDRAPDLLGPVATLDVRQASDGELWQAAGRLDRIVGEIAEANIIVPLLFNIWTAVLRSQARGHDPLRLTFDDMLADELAQHDPQAWLDRLGSSTPGGSGETRARREFLARFGHLSDSGNDISTPTWAEQPEVVDKLLATAGETTGGSGRMAWSGYLAGLPVPRRWLVAGLGRRARRYQVLREAVGSLFTRAYGLYRPIFLELGSRLAARGVLDSAEDVFFLSRREVADPPKGARSLVDERKAELDASLELQLPETIFGDDFVPSTRRDLVDRVLTGTAASRGRYTGRVRVITSVSQIDLLEEGDVLVVPYSDVGWTPLFARAGAVVAESGGLLSHSSIVAREYGLPCVVSVPSATSLPDGTTVTVDGHQGEVEVHRPD